MFHQFMDWEVTVNIKRKMLLNHFFHVFQCRGASASFFSCVQYFFILKYICIKGIYMTINVSFSLLIPNMETDFGEKCATVHSKFVV